MPCQSGPDEAYEEAQIKEREILTRLACEYCTMLEHRGAVPEYAKEWWEKHQAHDKARRQRELSLFRIQATREQIFKTLTAEEVNELKESL
jgi:hypothetical protein